MENKKNVFGPCDFSKLDPNMTIREYLEKCMDYKIKDVKKFCEDCCKEN